MKQSGIWNTTHGIDKQGITTTGSVAYNLEAPMLYEESIRRGEAVVMPGGPINAETGIHTGRSPKDKFVVRSAATEDTIWWDNNAAMSPEAYARLKSERVLSDSGHVHGVLSMMAAWRLKPLAAQLHRLRNPVFMALGAQDQTVPPALADEACQRLPQARQHIQPGLGHLAHEQDPQGTAEHILRWCTPR